MENVQDAVRSPKDTFIFHVMHVISHELECEHQRFPKICMHLTS